MSQYLVTGATGFLGTHLVDTLRAAGHEVVALCRSSAPALEGKARVARGDVNDAASVRAAMDGVTGVFHCAGLVSRDPDDAAHLHRVHVEGTTTVLDAARDAGVRRVVLASTSGVVAVSEEAKVLSEDAPAPLALLSRWPYYRSKLFAERAAFERATGGLEVVAVNPTLLLGPGDLRGSSTDDVARFLDGKIPFVPGGGLSFVDVRDVGPAMLAAMERGRSGRRYLLGAANMTLADFFARLERLSGVRAPRVPSPRGVELARLGVGLLDRVAKKLGGEAPVDRTSAEMAACFWYLDASRAKAELGFAPRDPMETLADTVRDLYDRGVCWPVVDAHG
jgi:dihydroflavonol-4-reductase